MREPIVLPTPQERADRLFEDEHSERRREWSARARVILSCFFWCIGGLALLGWSIHTTDGRFATVAFWGGILVGDLGMLSALLTYWRDSEELER